MSTTPVAPWLLLGADVVVNAVIILSALVLIAGVSMVAFNVSLPSPVLGFLVALLLGAVAMLALGATVAALAANERIAQIVGTFLFFPMMFFAGLWVPQQQMSPGCARSATTRRSARSSPDYRTRCTGHWPGGGHLAVLAATPWSSRSRRLDCSAGSNAVEAR